MNKLDYAYVNEQTISTSLVCPICLDVLEDPHIHTSCDSAFCRACLLKLAEPVCPICRWHWTSSVPLDYNMYLPKASRLIRNMLDELQVQCLHCRTVRRRGQLEHDCQPTDAPSPASAKPWQSLQVLSSGSLVFLFVVLIYSYPHVVFQKAVEHRQVSVRAVAVDIDRYLFDKLYYLIVNAIEHSMAVFLVNLLLWLGVLVYGDRWTSKATSQLVRKVLETSIIVNLITHSIYY